MRGRERGRILKWLLTGYSGTPLNRTPLGQSVHNSDFRRLGQTISVLFMEVSSIQGCPYRGIPLYIIVIVSRARLLSGGGESLALNMSEVYTQF